MQPDTSTQFADQATDDTPADNQAADDAPADSQSAAQPVDQSADNQAAEPASADGAPADGQAAEPPSDQPVAQDNSQDGQQAADPTDNSGNADGTQGQAGSQDALSAGRQNMLDLISKWMPTSLNQPHIPDGETVDLMAKAGWTKATGASNKKVKDAGGHPATSCGDILSAMLTLWKSNFIAAFGIRDTDATGHGPGAKKLGYYVEADGVKSPKPGDIVVLRNGFGPTSVGSVGHVGILVSAADDGWSTADGGGGMLPDQTACVTKRTIRFENKIPILKSPTDGKEKQLDGWVDLDKLTQSE
jgi:hypothetical protein